MIDFKIEGGSFVEDFDINSKNRYFQCVADIGRENVFITPISTKDITITVNDQEWIVGEQKEIKLREKGYGYVFLRVQINTKDDSYSKELKIMILKPAPSNKELYAEENSPRFHYTAPYGYLNDPNGMIYNAHTGEYHFFYQSFPYSYSQGPRHWGHAVTKDLVTFRNCKTAIYPDINGDMWSGTAIVDYNNTSGIFDENTPPAARILLVYYAWNKEATNAGLAYSPDGGETWVKADNSRLFNFIGAKPGHIDPKVFWFDEAGKWVMFCASGLVFTSDNLWDWQLNTRDHPNECPDTYEMTVEGTNEKKYVRTYGGTNYRVGTLRKNEEGLIEFIAESDFLEYNGDSLNRHNKEVEDILRTKGWYTGKTGSLYATQHYNNAPDGRIVSVSWLIEHGLDKTCTRAGAVTVATEHTLKRKGNGEYIIYNYPVKELEKLHDTLIFSCENTEIVPNGENILENVCATYADINATFTLNKNLKEIGFKLKKGNDGGFINIKYDAEKQLLVSDLSASNDEAFNTVRSMKMTTDKDGKISIRILLDSNFIENYGNLGEASICSVFRRENINNKMELYTLGGSAKIENLTIHTMKSMWES